MSEIDEIKSEIDLVKKKYLDNALEIISDYNKENDTKNDYKNRQIFELLQNADDCSIDSNSVNVKLELKNNILKIKNTGIPFNARGIKSFLHAAASGKDKNETIGNKGLGFRSVLNWANEILIVTKNFTVSFSQKNAKEYLSYLKDNVVNNRDELNKLDRTAILSSLKIIYYFDFKTELEDIYSTSIILTCNSEAIDKIYNELKSFQFEELLFLKHINHITIDTDSFHRNISCDKTKNNAIINDNGSITEYTLWQQCGIIENENRQNYELIIAMPKDELIREKLLESNYLYSYFKTDHKIYFPFLIHGTFNLTSERNNLIKNDKINQTIIEKLEDFIIDIALSFSKSVDYEPLMFCLPKRNHEFLDENYNFSNSLKNKLKDKKILPTIANTYISINDNPKLLKYDFSDILNQDRFSNLLKPCTNKTVEKFLKEDCYIKNYEYDEFVELINKDADSYANINNIDLDVKLIKLFVDEYSLEYSKKEGPLLLIDKFNNRIIDKSITVFNLPETDINVPSWSNLTFLNSSLNQKLSHAWEVDKTRLYTKLKDFNFTEYSFDKLLGSLNSQIGIDRNKAKDVIKWAYENYIKLGKINLNNNEVKLITLTGDIVNANNCYFSSLYNNEVGERILKSTNQNYYFIENPKELGLDNYDSDKVFEFLTQIGVKKYPQIKLTTLGSSDQLNYQNYNSKVFPTYLTTNNVSYLSNAFNPKEVKVGSIDNIQSIIIKSSFPDIIYWILDDLNLYKAIVSKTEINSNSLMKGRFETKERSDRFVSSKYMTSYLRMILTTTKYFPTISGVKTNVENLLLNDLQISPLMEALKFEYNLLPSFKVKKDVESLFEKMDIKDDLIDLNKEKIYKILLEIPNLTNLNNKTVKSIYSKINHAFKVENLKDIIENNKTYNQFIENGKVLCKINETYEYVPVENAYYVSNKINESILKDIPILELEKRVGDDKVKKMFGVDSVLKKLTLNIKNITSSKYAIEFNNYYKQILPYIYYIRATNDNKNKEFNLLITSHIELIENAKLEYTINENRGIIDFEIFQSFYDKNTKVLYICIPKYINSLIDLRKNAKFIKAFAEGISMILDIDFDKSYLSNILNHPSPKEYENDFVDMIDSDEINNFNNIKEKFGLDIDKKKQFIDCINKLTNKDIDSNLINNIDYDNINDIKNAKNIIVLFKNLNIDINLYNSNSLDEINLCNYYEQELQDLKNKYINKYNEYLFAQGFINSENEFTNKKKEFYDIKLDIKNSIYFNVFKEFEKKLGINLNELDKYEGNIDKYFDNLKFKNENNSNIDLKSNESYQNINDNFNNDLSIDDIPNIDIEPYCPSSEEIKNIRPKRQSHHTNTPREHSQKGDITRLENGFLGELYVYKSLKDKLNKNNYISWISGNGKKFDPSNIGDDSRGYDIEYSDELEIHYVEVKTTENKSNNIEFTLTDKEYRTGFDNSKNYEVYYVILDNSNPQNTKIVNLGHIFDLDSNETFFKNNMYSVKSKEYIISMKNYDKRYE